MSMFEMLLILELALLMLVFPAASLFYPDGQIHTVNLNTSEIGSSFAYAAASFGTRTPKSYGTLKGIIYRPTLEDIDACTSLHPPPHVDLPDGYIWIAIVIRSREHAMRKCDFIAKVFNAQKVGYGGVVIYNWDKSDDQLVTMKANNATFSHLIHIPSVFVTYDDGVVLLDMSYPVSQSNLYGITFDPYIDRFDAYQIILPIVFTFTGLLLIVCVVVIARWCSALRRLRRSRVSKSQLKKIPVEKYKKGDQYDCCAICLDDYEDGDKLRLLPCAHTYHQKCIDPWLLKNKRTCPVCKRRVIPRSHSRSDSSESDDSIDTHNERDPLLPQSSSVLRGAVGGAGLYGSGLFAAGITNQINYDSSSDEDYTAGPQQDMSDDEDEDSLNILIQASVTPPALRTRVTPLEEIDVIPPPLNDSTLAPSVLTLNDCHDVHQTVTNTTEEDLDGSNASDSSQRSLIV